MRTLFAVLLLCSAVALRADYRGKIRILNTSSTQQGYRVKSGGAVIVEDIIQPGYSSNYDFDGLSVDEVIVYRVVAGATYVGASYVAGSGEAEQLIGSGPLFSSDGPPMTMRFDFDVGGPAGPLADNKKTVWSVTDSTLTGGLFREGVDKIIGSSSSGSGGAFPAEGLGYLASSADALGKLEYRTNPTSGNITAATVTAPASQAALVDTAADGGPSFWARLKSVFGNVTVAEDGGTFINPAFGNSTLSLPSAATDDFSFGSVDALGQTFHFKPFVAWGDFRSNLNLIREIVLWFAVVFFVIHCRDKVEKYMIGLFGTPQIQTASEPVQLWVPGAGLTKSATMAGIWVTALVAVVGVSIGWINTQIGAFLPDVGIFSLFTSGAGKINDALASTGGGKAYKFLSEGIPIAALFELFAAQYIFGWSLPAVWGAAYLKAKVIYA